MDFGCGFNPRPSPGRCFKDPNSKTVDKECEVQDGSCKLKRSANTTKTTLPPVKTTLPVKTPAIPRDKNPGNLNGKISGPISAHATNLKNKSYNFYGDSHFSMSGTCKPCKDIQIPSLKPNIPPNSENCDDISVLLSNVFTQASAEKKWIDFYIEIPFLPKNKFRPTDKDVQEGVDDLGYLYKLYYIFYNCLNKTDCKYDTTRFHYVDVRLEYRQNDLEGLTEEMKQIIDMSGQKAPPSYTTYFNVYESYLSMERVEKCMNELTRMVMRQNRDRNSYIENTDKLMKDLYFSGGQTMSGKIEPKNYRLFKLYLTSDNFLQDATDLMDLSSLTNAQELLSARDHLVPPTMLVNRKGKTMHRIRSQLLSLEEEGQAELAETIVNFMLKQYLEKVNNSTIIDLWRSLMITYDGYINAKYRTMKDVYMLMDKLNKEFQKLMQIISVTINGWSLLMDAYTLSRMFRSYPGKNHVDSVKSIVYAGDAHISTYVNFFETVFNSSFHKYDPNKNLNVLKSLTRCLDVDMSHFQNI